MCFMNVRYSPVLADRVYGGRCGHSRNLDTCKRYSKQSTPSGLHPVSVNHQPTTTHLHNGAPSSRNPQGGEECLRAALPAQTGLPVRQSLPIFPQTTASNFRSPRPGINAAKSTALQSHYLPRIRSAKNVIQCRPEFVISLVRTPFLSPRYAQFRVPLNFNKLDLRDYLQNLYGVGVVSVRSYIEQQPITRMTRDGRNIGAWRRPQAQKRMTVELREPFVYPEEPKDLSPYVFPCSVLLCGEFVHGQHDDRLAHAINGIEHIANESPLLQTDGRRALGTRAKSGRQRCKRKCRMDPTRLRSPIPTCARPLRSRPRRLRRTPRSGGHLRRCWARTLRIRSSLGQGRSRRRLSGCRSRHWAALDLGVWLFF